MRFEELRELGPGEKVTREMLECLRDKHKELRRTELTLAAGHIENARELEKVEQYLDRAIQGENHD